MELKENLVWSKEAGQALEITRKLAVRTEQTAFTNTLRILESFRKHQVSDCHFVTSTGYGYGDLGRDKLDEVWADVFGAEMAFVRHQFVSGTHALSTALFGALAETAEPRSFWHVFRRRTSSRGGKLISWL